MRRRLIAIVFPMALSLAAPSVAQAGGSWLEIDPDRSVRAGGSGPWDVWGAWGGTVTMRAAGADWPHGTYATYLRLETGGQLVRVGEAVAGPAEHWVGAMTTTYEIPSVPTGRYVVLVCPLDDPTCSAVQTQGWIVIGETEVIAKLTLEVEQLRSEVAILQGAKASRAEKLAATEVSLARLEERIEHLREQIGFAHRDRDRASDRAVDAGELATEALTDAWAWRAVALLAIMALAAVLTVGWLRGRHTVRVRIPDSPEELIMFGAPKESPPGQRHRST